MSAASPLPVDPEDMLGLRWERYAGLTGGCCEWQEVGGLLDVVAPPRPVLGSLRVETGCITELPGAARV